jgi:hypothetical protein
VGLMVCTTAIVLVQGALVALRVETRWWWLMLAAGTLLAWGTIWVVARAMTPGERRGGRALSVAGVSLLLGACVTGLSACILWQLLWFLVAARGGS